MAAAILRRAGATPHARTHARGVPSRHCCASRCGGWRCCCRAHAPHLLAGADARMRGPRTCLRCPRSWPQGGLRAPPAFRVSGREGPSRDAAGACRVVATLPMVPSWRRSFCFRLYEERARQRPVLALQVAGKLVEMSALGGTLSDLHGPSSSRASFPRCSCTPVTGC